ncbi:carbohydrate ABC transporter membrane protein 1, CUT1 family (TC 3.A.1.1.-) [Gemmobacter aquatilis]|uniref:Carbohydrate ABC transporter membrane protein 1, CUT1 family (TC 3.A.1.1.-) n=1 Tax=Gemmobacter aquatilis TaxID=933059 RepID=A0A1H8FK57_9RHOB|nr:sugar ABC transporter permease [Gemmobacter aquatilis]SEN32143.1 carbohydrate ABC transporter membrane protein 1, CUT1 family (TC 3.A.1.1.-) [Gemmobacter aquatilis]
MTRQRFIFLTLAPATLVLVTLALVSTGGALWFSVMNRALRSPDSEFVGAYNYLRLLRDKRFFNALEISAIWEVVTVAGTLIVAVLLAVLVHETVKRALWRNLICFAFLAPVLLPRVAAAFIWRFLYSPSLGLANWFAGLFGIGPIEFLADPKIALLSVAVVDIWQWGLFFTVILVKLLETLPQDPIEAAMLDNARTWEIHAFVTLPMLRGPIISLALVKAVESLRSFDLIFVMTGGGPGTATETLDLYAYQSGINLGGRISYASAMSILLLVVTTVAFTFIWRAGKKWSR